MFVKDKPPESVILVFPRIAGNVTLPVLPFGLLAVASSLRRAGFFVRIIDLNIDSEQQLHDTLKTMKIIFVGFSVFTGPMIQQVLEISANIRISHPNVPLVWGGPHPTIMPELTIRHQLVDIVCRGEGERTAIRLAKAIAGNESLNDIPGLTFKRNGEIVSTDPGERISSEDVDREVSLDIGSIDLDPYVFMNNGKRTAVFITSRGCPYRCSFCWNLMFHERKYIAWSPQKVEAELKPLIDMKIDKVLIFDSFVGSVSRVHAMGEIFRRHHIEWAIEDGCRVDYHNSEEFFRGLKETGCTHVAFGSESGSQRILDLIHKDITVDDILRSARLSHAHGIKGRYQWMTGIPGETREDALKTVRLIDDVSRINAQSAHSLELYLPYPGNELFDMACKAGWRPPKNIEDWGVYRWQGRYPYHKEGTWFYKSIQYSNFFFRYSSLASMSAFSENIKPVFRAVNTLYWPFAAVRWKMRWFGMPVEYWLGESIRRFLEK